MPKYHVVKGIRMSNAEYEDFVKYLNNSRAESFRKQDVQAFLEWREDEMRARRARSKK